MKRVKVFDEDDQRKVRRRLNQLYWIFITLSLTVIAYGIGWVVAYTGSCVCSIN